MGLDAGRPGHPPPAHDQAAVRLRGPGHAGGAVATATWPPGSRPIRTRSGATRSSPSRRCMSRRTARDRGRAGRVRPAARPAAEPGTQRAGRSARRPDHARARVHRHRASRRGAQVRRRVRRRARFGCRWAPGPGPVESGYGLHLVLVRERVPGAVPPLAEVRDVGAARGAERAPGEGGRPALRADARQVRRLGANGRDTADDSSGACSVSFRRAGHDAGAGPPWPRTRSIPAISSCVRKARAAIRCSGSIPRRGKFRSI